MLNEDEHVKTVKENVQIKYLQMYNNYHSIKYVYGIHIQLCINILF